MPLPPNDVDPLGLHDGASPTRTGLNTSPLATLSCERDNQPGPPGDPYPHPGAAAWSQAGASPDARAAALGRAMFGPLLGGESPRDPRSPPPEPVTGIPGPGPGFGRFFPVPGADGVLPRVREPAPLPATLPPLTRQVEAVAPIARQRLELRVGVEHLSAGLPGTGDRMARRARDLRAAVEEAAAAGARDAGGDPGAPDVGPALRALGVAPWMAGGQAADPTRHAVLRALLDAYARGWEARARKAKAPPEPWRPKVSTQKDMGPLYHVTSAGAAKAIVAGGFLPSVSADMGPGVYLSPNPSIVPASIGNEEPVTIHVAAAGKYLHTDGDWATDIFRALYGPDEGDRRYEEARPALQAALTGRHPMMNQWQQVIFPLLRQHGYAGLVDDTRNGNVMVMDPSDVKPLAVLPHGTAATDEPAAPSPPAAAAPQPSAPSASAEQAVQTGPRGGRYVQTPSGRRYVREDGTDPAPPPARGRTGVAQVDALSPGQASPSILPLSDLPRLSAEDGPPKPPL